MESSSYGFCLKNAGPGDREGMRFEGRGSTATRAGMAHSRPARATRAEYWTGEYRNFDARVRSSWRGNALPDVHIGTPEQATAGSASHRPKRQYVDLRVSNGRGLALDLQQHFHTSIRNQTFPQCRCWPDTVARLHLLSVAPETGVDDIGVESALDEQLAHRLGTSL